MTRSFVGCSGFGSPRSGFALEHVGGFGGVADRLNAYNIYLGDPGLITSDVERFRTRDGGRGPGRRRALSRRAAAGRAFGLRPRQTNDLAAARPVGAAREQGGSDYRPPLPTSSGNLRAGYPALGVSARRFADGGRDDRDARRSGQSAGPIKRGWVN